jgi:hypothetical protein
LAVISIIIAKNFDLEKFSTLEKTYRPALDVMRNFKGSAPRLASTAAQFQAAMHGTAVYSVSEGRNTRATAKKN